MLETNEKQAPKSRTEGQKSHDIAVQHAERRKRKVEELEVRMKAGEKLSKNQMKKLKKLQNKANGYSDLQRLKGSPKIVDEADQAAVDGIVKVQPYIGDPSIRPPAPWDFFEKIGRPKFIVAPMVNQSELAFRLLCRRYGATLAYTPMLDSKQFASSETYRRQNFASCQQDRPLIVQFCGHDPSALLEAAKLVQGSCDAIDLNLGCPQGIARKGRYGSFLLEDTELVLKIVKHLSANINIPFTCKIRKFIDTDRTIQLVKDLEKAGCSMLTVHGRTKEQKGRDTGVCDWDIIKRVKEAVSIPVYANGAIHTMEDVKECLAATGCDGVMTSEAILENPDLFDPVGADCHKDTSAPNAISEYQKRQGRMAKEYVKLASIYSPHMLSAAKAHLFKILFVGLQEHTDLRAQLGSSKTMEDHQAVTHELVDNRVWKNVGTIDSTWYYRHRAVAERKSCGGGACEAKPGGSGDAASGAAGGTRCETEGKTGSTVD
jgi:tRNA-dihydrouridine synthase 1